jgi:hypothetical protein
MALSRFGTIKGLGTSYSSHSDFAPDTPTLDYQKVSYSSPYLVFKHYELASNLVALPGATRVAPVEASTRHRILPAVQVSCLIIFNSGSCSSGPAAMPARKKPFLS